MAMNTLQPVYYRVVINGADFAESDDGFIDDTTPEGYGPSNLPTTLAYSLKKEAANFRWQEIIQQISMTQSPIFVGSIAKGGDPDGDTAPTTFSFTVGFDRDDAVYTYNDEDDGSTMTGTTAIKRLVARAMMTAIAAQNTVVYDPTTVDSVVIGQCIRSVGATAISEDLSDVEDTITVTQISNI